MREADGECFRIGWVFVDTDEAAAKSGDLLSAMAEGCLTPDRILAAACLAYHPVTQSSTSNEARP